MVLKKDKITYTPGKVEKIYTVYEISKNININDYSILENCLFETVSLTKNVDINKDKYFEYEIVSDTHGRFSFPGTGIGRNTIIFRVDMSSSTKIDHRKKRYFDFR